jgi:hypothetical protein
MRWDQSPTKRGSPLVQALGSMVSRVLTKPWTIERPVTDAVIDPRVAAAKAVVLRCPIDTTDDTTREYSKTCVLYDREPSDVSGENVGYVRNYRQ